MGSKLRSENWVSSWVSHLDGSFRDRRCFGSSDFGSDFIKVLPFFTFYAAPKKYPLAKGETSTQNHWIFLVPAVCFRGVYLVVIPVFCLGIFPNR